MVYVIHSPLDACLLTYLRNLSPPAVGVCRLLSSVVCNAAHMQLNSPGAARGGPVVLRPVRATPCYSSFTIVDDNDHVDDDYDDTYEQGDAPYSWWRCANINRCHLNDYFYIR